LLVADCRVALGQLGALNRAAYDKPVVAITGSSGKTTVKEMLAASCVPAAWCCHPWQPEQRPRRAADLLESPRNTAPP
jgi:hypothetical protein